jgi:branched-subunit amino acid ABC-type transport system permease component
VTTRFQDLIVFSVLVLVMLARPTGFFGRPEIQKV